MSDYWIPITICISISLIAITRLWLEYKNKAEIQTTIRKALDNGEHLSIEVLDKIGVVNHSHTIDLRRAITLLALGIAVIAAGSLLNILNVAFAIAAFPITLAIAFLLLWKINQNEEKARNHQ
jgi:energy-converting hydrogenase Eha subunit C